VNKPIAKNARISGGEPPGVKNAAPVTSESLALVVLEAEVDEDDVVVEDGRVVVCSSMTLISHTA
jgi:hypothetical protein